MKQSPRRTQQERRTETRSKLLDATISCLVNDGFHGITTTKVCQLSGMSQGAIFKHFPTKNAKITSAIEKLYDQLIQNFEMRISEFPADGERIEICLTALWDLFSSPDLLAVYDLHIAARTDTVFQQELYMTGSMITACLK